jgi:hypothetical protein
MIWWLLCGRGWRDPSRGKSGAKVHQRWAQWSKPPWHPGSPKSGKAKRKPLPQHLNITGHGWREEFQRDLCAGFIQYEKNILSSNSQSEYGGSLAEQAYVYIGCTYGGGQRSTGFLRWLWLQCVPTSTRPRLGFNVPIILQGAQIKGV